MRWAAVHPRLAHPVRDVLDLLAAGATRDEILEDYPYLESDDITAVLAFAALQNDHPVLRSA